MKRVENLSGSNSLSRRQFMIASGVGAAATVGTVSGMPAYGAMAAQSCTENTGILIEDPLIPNSGPTGVEYKIKQKATPYVLTSRMEPRVDQSVRGQWQVCPEGGSRTPVAFSYPNPQNQNWIADNDYVTDNVYILDPSTHIHTNTLPQLLRASVTNLTMADLWLSGTDLKTDAAGNVDPSTGILMMRPTGTFRRLKLSDAPNVGMSNISGTIEAVEVVNCGTPEAAPDPSTAQASAIKAVRTQTIRRAYIHDCQRHGIWWDVNKFDGIVERCLFENIRGNAFWTEVSGGATAARQRLYYCEFRGYSGAPAISITASSRVACHHIRIRPGWSGHPAIVIRTDDRRPEAPTDIKLHNIDFGGGLLRLSRGITLGGHGSGADVEWWQIKDCGGVEWI